MRSEAQRALLAERDLHDLHDLEAAAGGGAREHVGDGVMQPPEHDRGGRAMEADRRLDGGPLHTQCANRGERAHLVLPAKRGQASEPFVRWREVRGLGSRSVRERPRPWEHVQTHRAFELRKHVGDWRDPNHRIGAEAPTVCVGAREAAVQVDRTSAHAGHAPRPIQERVRRSDQNQILIGPEVPKDIDDLDIKPLGRRASKDGKAVALHSWPDFVHVDEARRRLGDGGAQQRCTQYKTQPGE